MDSRLLWERINNSVNVTEYKIHDTEIKDWPADRRLWRTAEEKQGPLSLSQLGVSVCKKQTHISWSQFNPYMLFLKCSSLWSNSLLKMEAPWSQVCGAFRDYGMSQKVIQPLITDITEWFCSASGLCAITQLLLECEKISYFCISSTTFCQVWSSFKTLYYVFLADDLNSIVRLKNNKDATHLHCPLVVTCINIWYDFALRLSR